MRRLLPLLLLAFLWAVPAQAQQAACSAGCINQNNANSFGSTTGGTSLTGVVAGHDIRLFLCVAPDTLTFTGVTVNGVAATIGPTFTGVASTTFNCGMAYFPNATSGTNTVVATASASATQIQVSEEEWAGDATSATLDGQNALYTQGSTSGTSLPGGSITTTGCNDTVEVFLNQAQGTAATIPAGYTTAQNIGNFIVSAFKTGVTASTINPAYTSTGGADNNVVTAAFKSLSACGAVAHRRLLQGVGQ